jgi:hypothetical protein
VFAVFMRKTPACRPLRANARVERKTGPVTLSSTTAPNFHLGTSLHSFQVQKRSSTCQVGTFGQKDRYFLYKCTDAHILSIAQIAHRDPTIAL